MPTDNHHSDDVKKAQGGSLRRPGVFGRTLRGRKVLVGAMIIVSVVLLLVGGKMALEIYEQQLSVTSEKIQRIEEKLSKYSEADLNSAELLREFGILQDRVEHLDKQLSLFDQTISEISHSRAGDRGWEGKYRRLATQVDVLRREVRSLRAANPNTQFLASGVLFTLSRLRTNLIQGRGCSTELEIMRRFIKEVPALISHADALSLYCEKGVPTETNLQQTFPAVARAVMRKNDKLDDGKWWRRFSSVLTNLVSVRPFGPQVAGQNPAALLARTEVFLAAGDLLGALTTIEQLGVIEGVVLEWREGLAARIFAIGKVDKIAEALMGATMEGVADND